MRTNNILIIESDSQLRAVLAMALEAEGQKVLFAENSSEALSNLDDLSPQDHIDLIMYQMTFRSTQPEFDHLLEACTEKFGVVPAIFNHHNSRLKTKLVDIQDIHSALTKLSA